MLEALSAARRLGQLRIPTVTPHALRLRFYGLKAALRRENREELCEDLVFLLEPDAIIIQTNTNSALSLDVAAALQNLGTVSPNPVDDANAALDRILGSSK